MIKTIRKSIVECKIAIISLTFILINYNFYGQTNLVPNPSFENYTICPPWGMGGEQICIVEPWFQPYFPDEVWCGGSTELYHFCSGVIPNNFGGYQFPKTGNGMAGMTIIQNSMGVTDDWREYLEIKLISLLFSNKKYCIEWQTNLANISSNGCNRIGAFFSSDTLFQIGSQYDYINVNPQIENLEINSDTINWTLFHEIYSAQGFEQFMTIGNFRPGSMTDTSNTINSGGAWAYYYFDDFGVYELPEINAGVDGEICEYGGSVQLQANCDGCWDALKYRWWPETGLSDPSVLNPLAAPLETTTYYFGLIDTTETVPCIVDLVDSVVVTVCDGIEPPAFNFTIQPNPGQNQVELVFTHVPEDTKLFLYDLRGRLILKQVVPKATKIFTLDLTNFANAQYMLKLENSSGMVRKKLMKM